MNETLQYLKMFAQFPFALRRFARNAMAPEKAAAIVRQKLDTRAESLRQMLAAGVFAHQASPYLALFRNARCEFGDVEHLLRDKSVDDALEDLRAAGIYLRLEEFKGREPIVRGGLELPVKARDFDNPAARRHFTVRTGGSTGLPTLVSQDLDHVVEKAPLQMLHLQAYDLSGVPAAHWMHILPGSGFRFLMHRAYLREPSERWFSSLGWREHREWPRFTAATFYMTTAARFAGLDIPFPEFVPLDQALVVARWMSETARRAGKCMLATNVSHAMRACIAARDDGLDLSGVTLRIGGEPVTEAKSSFMTSLGANVIGGYGMVESGNIGLGCPNGVSSDDVHLAMDSMALITAPAQVGSTGITVPSFLLTTLAASSGKLMLNLQVDDCGVVERRRCGCLLGENGLDIHLRDIRSYTKLVGEGVTLMGQDMVKILEEVLPSRFGGSSLDYQLLEEEDENGLTRLFLIISPRVSIPDEGRVVQVLHEALAHSSAAGGFASAVWSQGDTIRVRRTEPVWTARGKLMPLHVERYRNTVSPNGS